MNQAATDRPAPGGDRPGLQGRRWVAERIALGYAGLASLWIVLSDWVVARGFPQAALYEYWSTVKGLAFVALTAGLLWMLVRSLLLLAERDATRWQAAEAGLRATEEQLRREMAESERRNQAREAAESRLRILQRAVEQSPASIVITDTEGRIDYVNPTFSRVTGYAKEEVLGANPRVLKSGEAPPGMYRELWKTIVRGGEWRGEFHNRRKNGELFWEEALISPVTDAAGRITHFLAIKEDVSERKEAARALQESEEMYRTLVTASPDPIVVLSPDGRLEFVSPRARQAFGYDEAAALTGRDMLEYVVSRDRARAVRGLAAATQPGSGVISDDYVLLRRDRTEFHAEVSVAARRTAAGELRGIVVIVRDVTARRLAEERLQASEERFRQVVETIAEVFWVLDLRSLQVVYVSPSFETVWRRPCADLYRSRRVWLDSLHEADRARMMELTEGLPQRGAYEATYRIVRPDGSIRWIHERAFAVKDDGGQAVRIVGVARDATEKNEIEQRFYRAQRLESIGTLASGVAHDINNILAPMLVVPSLLKERLAEQADRDLLAIVEQSARRGAGIVRQLLTFSRGQEGHRGVVQVGHLAKEMLNIMRETFPREIALQWHQRRELVPIHADPTQIHQVLMNLCVNARDAMPNGGALTLSADVVELGEDASRLDPAARPGRYVLLEVADTGHGIDPGDIDRIFDPFFTTKGLGKGTGLGLSTVLGIVRSHGGFLMVESDRKVGTVFKAYLPAADAGKDSNAPGSTAPFAHGHGELILVADDEEAIRVTLQQLLEAAGYRVVLAGDGRDALGSFTPDVRLVLTDLMMPLMGGTTFIRALRLEAPELPILAMTGLSHEVGEETLRELGVARLLRKPVPGRELIDAVSQTLAAATAAR